MTLPVFCILDVGHGNAAILRDVNGVLVIDTGSRQRLLQFLISNSISQIDAIIISHADQDHMAGLIDLLLSEHIEIRAIHLNSDPSQGSEVWNDVVYAIADARNRYVVEIDASVHTDHTWDFDQGKVRMEILAPDVTDVLKGIGSTDNKGRRIDRHALNVVARLSYGSRRVVLLPGDINNTGLDKLIERKQDLDAEVLVFPHHGGKPGPHNPIEFTRRICDLVRPSYVVFSVADRREHHPRADVIDTIRESASSCVMLSTGEARPLSELIEEVPTCNHRSGTGHISIAVSENPLRPVFSRA